MAVFLTQSSPGQRTSPVKRGYWVARNVLGQHIPAPPPNVPAIPSNEADLGNLTLAQTMARHREDPNCASCHATFDFFGLAFEGYGPVGERRERDLGGRTVQPTTEFPDGVQRSGVSGILEYVAHGPTAGLHRQPFAPAGELCARPRRASLRIASCSSRCQPSCAATDIGSAASSKPWSPARSSSSSECRRMPAPCVARCRARKVSDRIMTMAMNAAVASRRHVPARRGRRHAPPVAGVDPRVGRRRAQAGTTRSPGVSPSCSWPTASTRTTGGRRARARRWSWALARAAAAASGSG